MDRSDKRSARPTEQTEQPTVPAQVTRTTLQPAVVDQRDKGRADVRPVKPRPANQQSRQLAEKGRGDAKRDAISRKNKNTENKKRGVISNSWQVNQHLAEKTKEHRHFAIPRKHGPPVKRTIIYASPRGEEPWKYLKKVKASLESAPRILLVKQELWMHRELKRAVLILPTQLATRGAQADVIQWKGTNKFERIAERRNELMVYRRERWFYVGSYQGDSVTTLEPAAFEVLPQSMKDEVYRLTAGSMTSPANIHQKIADLYRNGELRAASITFHCVGVNAAITEGLTDAMNQCYRSRSRRAPLSMVELS